jgi:hypothetical protein
MLPNKIDEIMSNYDKYQRLTPLFSVGCYLDSKTSTIYPMLSNGTADWDNGVHIMDCTDEFFDNLGSNVEDLTVVTEQCKAVA